VLFLLLAGCPYRPECTPLRPYEDLRNHTSTFEIALDVTRRRVYASSLVAPTVVELDADSGEVLDVHVLAFDPIARAEVAVDDQGVLWLAGDSPTFLARRDPEGGSRTEYRSPLTNATGIAPVPGGGVLVSGRLVDDRPQLLLVDADGVTAEPVPLEARVRSLAPLGDEVGLFYDREIAGLERRSLPGLELIESCDLPFVATRGARLDDGSWVIAHEDQVGLVRCDGTPGQAWTVGSENHDVISLGSQALVLERLGDPAQGFDPNYGVALRVGPDGLEERPAYATAKNTGFGAYDPVTGLLWVNSEGTSEVWGLDADTGAVVHRTRTGTFLDGLALDPTETDVVFATGRLSDTVVRIDEGAVTASTEDVFWPFSPQIDADRDRLWVWAQADAQVVGLDRHSLEVAEVWDPGFGPNGLLTFGSLIYHPKRRTLFVAESRADVLVEWDPDTGQEVRRWSLGGPLVRDPDAIGELLVLVDPDSEALLVARSNDARVQRIDPDSRTIDTTVWLDDDLVQDLADGSAMDFARVSQPDEVIYVGGTALDLETLAVRPELELEASRVIGVHPRRPGERLVVDPERRELWSLDAASKDVRGRLGFAQQDLMAVIFRVDHERDAVVMTRSREAYVCPFDVTEIE